MTQTPTETLTAAVPELTWYRAIDLDALWHGLSMLSLEDDRRRVLDDIKAKGFAADDGGGIALTERGAEALAALQRWMQDTIAADVLETQPGNLRLIETALRMQAERIADHPYYVCAMADIALHEREHRGCARCLSGGRTRERVVECIMLDWLAKAAARGAETEVSENGTL